MRTLEARERRLIAVGLLLASVALAWLAVVSPILRGFEGRAVRRETLLSQYRANQRLLASVPALQAAAGEQRRTAALYQVGAPSQEVAAEALKQRLAAELTAAGGSVGAVQRVQADMPPGWVGVRADVQISLAQLVAGIRQLENEAPYVVVQYVSIGADRASSTGHSALLDVRLQVAALFRAPPAR